MTLFGRKRPRGSQCKSPISAARQGWCSRPQLQAAGQTPQTPNERVRIRPISVPKRKMSDVEQVRLMHLGNTPTQSGRRKPGRVGDHSRGGHWASTFFFLFLCKTWLLPSPYCLSFLTTCLPPCGPTCVLQFVVFCVCVLGQRE